MILAVKNTTANIEVGLTSFTYQIKQKNYYFLITKIIENLSNQIVNNTEPKRSFLIVVSDNKTRFKTWFEPLIQLDKKKDYEIALINLKTYYIFLNIDKSNNVLVIHPGLTYNGLTLIFLKVIITLKILTSLFNEKWKNTHYVKQMIRFTLKSLLTPTH